MKRSRGNPRPCLAKMLNRIQVAATLAALLIDWTDHVLESHRIECSSLSINALHFIVKHINAVTQSYPVFPPIFRDNCAWSERVNFNPIVCCPAFAHTFCPAYVFIFPSSFSARMHLIVFSTAPTSGHAPFSTTWCCSLRWPTEICFSVFPPLKGKTNGCGLW